MKKIALTIIYSLIMSQNINAVQSLSYEALFDQSNSSDFQSEDIKKENLPIIHRHLPNAHLGDLKQALQTFYPHINIVCDHNKSMVSIQGEKAILDTIDTFIEHWNSPLTPITFHFKILEISYESFEQYKALFSDLTDSIKVNYNTQTKKVINIPLLEASLVALSKKGHAKLLARPSVSTLDTHQAHIKIGDKLPYITTTIQNQTQRHSLHQVDTGIDITITPKITAKNTLISTLQIHISTVKLWKEIDHIAYPVLSTREVSTTLQLKHKDTLILAGFLQENEIKNNNHTPFLGTLPILKHLFRSKKKESHHTDIMICITPEIKYEKLKPLKIEKALE